MPTVTTEECRSRCRVWKKTSGNLCAQTPLRLVNVAVLTRKRDVHSARSAATGSRRRAALLRHTQWTLTALGHADGQHDIAEALSTWRRREPRAPRAPPTPRTRGRSYLWGRDILPIRSEIAGDIAWAPRPRMPILAVRSVTLTSMMFIITMPTSESTGGDGA